MKEDHDFNWVKARQDCSLSIEFIALHRTAQRNTEERQKGLGPDHEVRLKFKNIDDHKFMVLRSGPGSSGYVEFILHRDHITVEKSDLTAVEQSFKLTLTLNDEGECRFKIDGKGEYLRWQVARKGLEEIFFHGLFQES